MPYIFADPERVAAWHDELAGDASFKVGIAWQGNPHAPYDRERSIPLAHFEPLARVPGVRLFSLQKGPGVEQLAAATDLNIVDFGDRLDATGGAFMDTAAIIENLDLVITSDTARGAPGRSPGRERLGGATNRARLALVARARRQPLVSDDATVPPMPPRRLGRSV